MHIEKGSERVERESERERVQIEKGRDREREVVRIQKGRELERIQLDKASVRERK